MTQVVNHKGKRLKVGPRGGGGVTIFIYMLVAVTEGTTILTPTCIVLTIRTPAKDTHSLEGALKSL